MSKPKPIEYTLHNWSIEYEGQYFDSSAATGTCHYMAHITWEAGHPNGSIKTATKVADQKIFTTWEDAKKWIDKEISDD